MLLENGGRLALAEAAGLVELDRQRRLRSAPVLCSANQGYARIAGLRWIDPGAPRFAAELEIGDERR